MAEIDGAVHYAAWAGIIGTLAGGALGSWLTYKLQKKHEADRTSEIRGMHVAALEAEIIYNARLAATYIDEGIVAPLYRFTRTVYDTVYATLVSEILTGEDIEALTGFYSLVDQMNRGLDDIARHVAEDRHDQDEHRRLLHKAAQMRHGDGGERRAHPTSEFYVNALASVRRHR